MLTINRILLATTMQEKGALVPLTLQLAQATGAEIHVVHVREAGSPGHDAESLASWFRQQAANATSYPEKKLIYDVLHGDSEASAISAYAEAKAIDLLVVGTPQNERTAPGISTAHQLIRQTMLPVLVCPTSTRTGGIQAIMAPVDFSKPARHACLHALALAALFRARLDVVHVVRGLASPEATDLASSVASFCADVLGTDAEVQVAVRSGNPAARIVSAAREWGTDLIVLQTHGLAGLSRVALGSVAKRVLHDAPCAVLLLRTYGHALFHAAQRHPERRVSAG
ncbi:MAG: universal stress protein [Bacteroidota bacterium]